MANINISRILIKRGNTATANTYVGPLGELVVDTGLKTLRLQDGSTPGGMSTLVNSVQFANLSSVVSNIVANTSGLYSNANVASYLLTSGTITGINANIVAANAAIVLLQSNSTTQAAQITNIITTANANINAYLSTSTIASLTTSGNLIVGGNLFVNGNTTTISASNLIISDNIVYFADGNPANTLDIGIAGHFNNGRYQHTGLIRQASTGQWKLFSNVVPEPGSTIDFTNAVYDAIQVGNISSPTVTDLYANAATQAGLITTLQSNAGVQADAITTLTANAGVQADAITTLTANAATQLGQITAANAAITTLQANLGATQIWANANIASINANLGGYYTWANANVAGLYTSILGANTAWQANAVTQQGLITTLQTNAASQDTAINSITANIGGFYTWANTNFGTSSYANANVAAYLAGNITIGNIVTTTANATIFKGNSFTYPNGVSILSGYSTVVGPTSLDDTQQLPIIVYKSSVNQLVTASGNAGSIPTYQPHTGGMNAWTFNSQATTGNGITSLSSISASGNVYVTANVMAGNVTATNYYGANYLFANGVNILSTIAASSTYSNANVTAYLVASPQSGTYSNTNVAAYLVANPQSSTYSNANVIANLQNLTSNVSTTANLVATGNVYGANFVGNITTGANITASYFITTGAYGNISQVNTISANNYVYANGVSILSGISATSTYGDSNVTVLLSGNTVSNISLTSNASIAGNLTVGTGQGGFLFRKLAGGSGAALYNLNVTPSVTNYNMLTDGGSLTFNTAGGGSIYTGINNSIVTTVSSTGLSTTGNITATGNVISPNYLFANGVNILSTIAPSSTYSNTNVAAYLTTQTFYSNSNVASYLVANPQAGTYSNTNVAAYLTTATVTTTGNITTTANLIAPNYLFANGVNILSTVTGGAGTYSNTNVSAYLTTATISTTGNITAGNLIGTQYGNTYGTTASYSGNVTAANFIGNGAALSGLTYAGIGNIYGSSSNVTLQAGNYNWTFDNTGNLVIPTTGNIVYANSTVFTSGTGGGTNYSNNNVVSMLAANTSVFIGNTGNVSVPSVYQLQSNITQLFIGGNTTLTSGNAASPNSTFLMYNGYFAANGTLLTRNTTTGVGYISIDSTGIGIGGYTGAVTANTVPTFNQFLRMNGSIGAVFSGAITGSGGVYTTVVQATAGLVLNTSATITTNQASASIFPATATTIAIGTAATTITLGSTTAGGVGSNVFVGNAVGTQTGNLTVRARGTYNVLTLFNSQGGYNSPPYNNITLTGGSGTGMTASWSSVGGYVNGAITVNNPGSGYRNGDILTLPGGIGSTVILTNYNSGVTNGTTIGQADYSFGMDGNLSLPGNVTLSSNSAVIGDFSNSTFNYRTVFRTITANSTTGIYAVPSGTGTGAAWQAANSSNIANTSKVMITTNGNTDVQLVSGINGTGTYLPLSFLTSGSTQMQLGTAGNLNMVTGGNIATTGNIIAGNLTTSGYGQFTGAFNESTTIAGVFVGNTGSGTGTPRAAFFNGNTTQNWQIDNYFGAFRWFTPGVTRMSLDGNTNQLTVSGNVSSTNLLASGDATITGNLTVSGINSGYAPNRPAFRISGNGATIVSTTTVSGGYMVVDYNQGSYLNTSTGIFTAPVAGLYQVNLVVRASGNSNPSAQVIIRKTSGGTTTNIIMIEYAANTTMNHTGGSTVIKLAVGDTLKFDVTVGSVSFDVNDNWSVAYIG